MPLGDPTLQPFGHRDFCLRLPAECQPLPGLPAPPAVLDMQLKLLVAQVNTDVNTEVTPASDQATYGTEEFWSYPTSGKGDCEDYALEKRRRLHEAGVPLGDLLMTVVRKPDGTGHAVLTLRTQSGDFVLDNLDWRVRPWGEVGYRFIKRQQVENPGRWVSIERDSEPLVSAVDK
ncbi:transglutaminase-like cysteine peptidase [Aureimonas sp. AU40]|uniref:transglutaminase-like cysteine peptidase n=1 Tax=Aureimonas sp. AU40 TaxID=1637747 RepID=UPI000A505452|nr:transglutaminase-like cysteine peptidase [Aureimonas sp. AU40]